MSIFSKRSASVSLWPKVKKSTLPVTPFLIFGANEKSSCFLCENSCSFLIFIYFNCYLFKFLSIHPCIGKSSVRFLLIFFGYTIKYFRLKVIVAITRKCNRHVIKLSDFLPICYR